MIFEVFRDGMNRLLARFERAVKRWVKVLMGPQDLRQLLLFLSGSSVLRRAINLLLGRMGLAVLELNPYSSIAKNAQSVLAGQVRSVILAPKEQGECPRSRESEFPCIRARHFESGLINSSNSAVVHRGKIFVPDYYYDNRSRVLCSGGHLQSMHDTLGLIGVRDKYSQPIGVAITGLGSSNWYHWLIEILPLAMLSSRLPIPFRDYPLLVSDDYAKNANFRDSLEPFRLGRRVVELDKSSNCSVGDLIVIDSPVQGPFNLGPGLWPKVADYQLNTDVLYEFRGKILKSLSIEVARPTEMLFLARNNSRRSYNQDDLLEIAQRFGFMVVYPETLSFREQVQLFYSARCIVGASGAAWANILFCQSSTIGLTWTFPEYREFCVYSSLAGIVGMDLSYLFVAAAEELSDTAKAYDMDYQVSPVSFTRSLESILTPIQPRNEPRPKGP